MYLLPPHEGYSFLSKLLKPLLGRTRSQGRCWAAIRLPHRPEPSGHAVHEEVDGLDIGGQHGRWFVLRHTHRPQRRPYPICTSRSGNSQHRCGGAYAGSRLCLEGSFWGVGAGVGDENPSRLMRTNRHFFSPLLAFFSYTTWASGNIALLCTLTFCSSPHKLFWDTNMRSDFWSCLTDYMHL